MELAGSRSAEGRGAGQEEAGDDEHAVVHSHIAAVVAERDTLVGEEAEPWRQALPDGPLRGRWVMTKWGQQSCCLPCNFLLHIPRKLVSKKKRRCVRCLGSFAAAHRSHRRCTG